MSDLLQDHIHSPEPYEDDDAPKPSRALVQLKRDLAQMSIDEQSDALAPDSTGEPFGMIDTLQRKMEAHGESPWLAMPAVGDTVQMAKEPGGTLAQPQDVSPFKDFVQIAMGINVETAGDYGPDLEAWLSAAAIPGGLPGAAFKALAEILKKVNPVTAGIYGPFLDAWAAQATGPDLTALLPMLAKIMKLADPRTVAAYGPPLDAWGMGAAPNAAAVEATMPEPIALSKPPLPDQIMGMAPPPLVILSLVLQDVNPDAAGIAAPLLDAFLGDPGNWDLFAEAAKLLLPAQADGIDEWLAGGANVMQLAEVLGEDAAVWGEMVLAAVATAGTAALEPVQGKGMGASDTSSIKSAAAEGVSGSGGKMPHHDRIQASFGGHDISSIDAHVGGKAAKASESMGAVAYATGSKVAFKSAPDLHTAAHEAAHIVQQAQGVSLPGGVGSVGDSYEKAADAVADRVVSGQSAADLLGGGGGGGGVQKKVQRLGDPAVQREETAAQDQDSSSTADGQITPSTKDRSNQQTDNS